MTNDLVRQKPEADAEHAVNPVLPVNPENVFALVIDYTTRTRDELFNISTLIGGGTGKVHKLDPALLEAKATKPKAVQQLSRALQAYPCTMLFLLVPWGMPGVELALEVMRAVGRQEPRVVFEIGGSAYSIELSMATGPMPDIFVELRQLYGEVDNALGFAQDNT